VKFLIKVQNRYRLGRGQSDSP